MVTPRRSEYGTLDEFAVPDGFGEEVQIFDESFNVFESMTNHCREDDSTNGKISIDSNKTFIKKEEEELALDEPNSRKSFIKEFPFQDADDDSSFCERIPGGFRDSLLPENADYNTLSNVHDLETFFGSNTLSVDDTKGNLLNPRNPMLKKLLSLEKDIPVLY